MIGVAPLAYAQMQAIEQAVTTTGSLEDDVLTAYTRQAVFDTVVGEVKFGERGEWAHPRVVQVQFQNVASNEVGEFKDTGKPVVVAPGEFASGNLIYPFAGASSRASV